MKHVPIKNNNNNNNNNNRLICVFSFTQLLGIETGTKFAPPYAIFYGWVRGKNSHCFRGESYDMVVVHIFLFVNMEKIL